MNAGQWILCMTVVAITPFRTFNVIDDYIDEVLEIDIAVNLTASRISCYLDKLAKYHGYSFKI
jgi:putative transposase